MKTSGALEPASSPRRVRLYGLTVESWFLFTNPLPASDGPPDLEIRIADAAPREMGGAVHETLWKSPELVAGASPQTRLERHGDWWRLCFHGAGDFWLRRDADGRPGRIVAVPEPGAPAVMIELRFLGPVLAFWLELAGIVALHASAVVVGGRAVAFVAGNHGGKSSLSAALMERGHPLLSDDLLPVEETAAGFVARPGYPQMRFWPEDAERVAGAAEELPKVHPELSKRRLAVGPGAFGRFEASPRPLTHLFVLDRGADPVEPRVEELAPSDALIHLARASFLPRLVVGAGLQPRRLAVLSRLVESVPVRRLVYPSDLAALSRVADTVVDWTLRVGSEGL